MNTSDAKRQCTVTWWTNTVPLYFMAWNSSCNVLSAGMWSYRTLGFKAESLWPHHTELSISIQTDRIRRGPRQLFSHLLQGPDSEPSREHRCCSEATDSCYWLTSRAFNALSAEILSLPSHHQNYNQWQTHTHTCTVNQVIFLSKLDS